MPVLKDVECTRCNTRHEDVVDREASRPILLCKRCKRTTEHITICNGGTRTRFRFNDWSGYEPSLNELEFTGAEVVNVDDNGNETAVQSKYGGVIHERKRFRDADVRNENRDKIGFASKKRKGKAPIRLDMKGSKHA